MLQARNPAPRAGRQSRERPVRGPPHPLGGDSITLGDATAKASVSDQDTKKTWILFGDPTTKLK